MACDAADPHPPEPERLAEPMLDRRTALQAEALACLIARRLSQGAQLDAGCARFPAGRLASDLLETGLMLITHDGAALHLTAHGITSRTPGSAIAAALKDWCAAAARRIAQGVTR